MNRPERARGAGVLPPLVAVVSNAGVSLEGES